MNVCGFLIMMTQEFPLYSNTGMLEEKLPIQLITFTGKEEGKDERVMLVWIYSLMNRMKVV